VGVFLVLLLLLVVPAATATTTATAVALINCGSDASYVDSHGMQWEADDENTPNSAVAQTSLPISGTPDPFLYETAEQAVLFSTYRLYII